MITQPTTVAQLQEAVRNFRDERNWRRFHSPKNLSMSIAIEAAELMEHFQWLTVDQAEQLVQQDERTSQPILDELADVLIYCLSMANALNCNAADIVIDKLAKSAAKYPADLYKYKKDPKGF